MVTARPAAEKPSFGIRVALPQSSAKTVYGDGGHGAMMRHKVNPIGKWN